jgi:phage head maturation protease
MVIQWTDEDNCFLVGFRDFIDAIALINLIQDKVKTLYNLSDIQISLGISQN